MFFWDPTYILVIIGLLISMAASAYVNRTFRRYDTVRSRSGVTGTDAARYILQQSGINDVAVQEISGDLTDNYNGQTKILSLSNSTAQSTSVAAMVWRLTNVATQFKISATIFLCGFVLQSYLQLILALRYRFP